MSKIEQIKKDTAILKEIQALEALKDSDQIVSFITVDSEIMRLEAKLNQGETV